MTCQTVKQARRIYARLYLWAAERLYHELAPIYDVVSWLVSAGRWARWRRVALDYVRGPVVLEVGFGTGELLREMATQGRRVIGLDASAAMQRVTSRKLAHMTLVPLRIRGRVQALPLRAACCDTVVSTFPAPYIIERASLTEIARVLRPGGSLVVVGLAMYNERREDEPWFSLTPPGEPGIDAFCGVAESAGLSVRRITRLDPPIRLPVLIALRDA